MALTYEVVLLLRGRQHAYAPKALALPIALFAAVVIWILLQNAPFLPASLQHPIWAMAAEALDRGRRWPDDG